MPTVTPSVPLEGVVQPLDAARRALLRATRRVPVLASALRSAESRIPFIAALSVIFSLMVACFAPGVLLILGPVSFGVPHVASDVRYLVLRQQRPAHWTACVALGCAALIVLRIVEMSGARRFPFALLEASIGWGWIAVATWIGALAAAPRRRWRRAGLVTLPIAAVTALAVAYPLPARGLLAFAHNLVAPVIWLVLFRGRKARAALPLVLLGAGSCLLLWGATISWLPMGGPWVTDFIAEARGRTPALAPEMSLGIGLCYVFLQAVHYSIWLVWIPQEQIRGSAMLTFRMSVRAARRDFGGRGLALIAAATLALAVASFVSVHAARNFYLSVATFHAYLELACLAFLWTQRVGRTPALASSPDERAT